MLSRRSRSKVRSVPVSVASPEMILLAVPLWNVPMLMITGVVISTFQDVLAQVIALVAYYLAFNGGSVHTIAMFAASGLGASFGPVVIASLYGNSINWKGAVASIFSGMIVVIIWFYSGLSNYLFEVFPGWIVSTVALFAVSKATGGPDQEITENYKKYLKVLRD